MVRSAMGWRIAGAVAALGAALLLAAPAAAYPQGAFACYASALHVDGANDPLVANSSAVPCQSQSQSAASNQVNGPPGTAQSGRNSATTGGILHDVPQDGDTATAQATALEAVIVSGNTVIKADVFNTKAAVVCTSASPVFSGSASVGDLTVNGNSIPLTGGPQTVSTPAGPLHVAATYQPASNVFEERGLWLQTAQGDIVVSEAAVGYVNTPCVNGSPPPPPSPPNPGLGCRGVALQNNGSFNFTANLAVVPCVSSSQSASTLTGDAGSVSASGLYARTGSSPDPLPTYSALTPFPSGTYVTADAGAANVELALGGGQDVAAGPVSAHGAGACLNRAPALQSSSSVVGLRVGATHFADSTMPMDIALPGGGTLHVNWYYSDGYYVARRALWLEAPSQGLSVIVGDVIAGANDANPC